MNISIELAGRVSHHSASHGTSSNSQLQWACPVYLQDIIHASSAKPSAQVSPRSCRPYQPHFTRINQAVKPPAANGNAIDEGICGLVRAFSLSKRVFPGKTAPLKLVSPENGAVFNGAQSTFTPSAPAPAPTHAPAPTAFNAPPPITKAVTMPTDVLQTPVLLRSESAPVPRPASPISESPVILTPPTQVDDEVRSLAMRRARPFALEAEVDRLNSELRAAREKIRNMQLQVEDLKANERKAAQALMEA
ncbi:hypothetical protein EV424DRAFT_1587595 [Suillus variegatus]|nr:hypothetical protein EV424DRAFT_1587595 [Suillus variegatus]